MLNLSGLKKCHLFSFLEFTKKYIFIYKYIITINHSLIFMALE